MESWPRPASGRGAWACGRARLDRPPRAVSSPPSSKYENEERGSASEAAASRRLTSAIMWAMDAICVRDSSVLVTPMPVRW